MSTCEDEIRELILDGTLIPLTRDDCVVCDDLGCEFCPHVDAKGATE